MFVYCMENCMTVYKTVDNFVFVIISSVVHGCKNTFPKIEPEVSHLIMFLCITPSALFAHSDTGF